MPQDFWWDRMELISSEAQLLTGISNTLLLLSPQRYVAINSGFDADAPLVVVNDADKKQGPSNLH